MHIGFFINPSGDMVKLSGGTHIATVIGNPELFGFTNEFVHNTYEKYDEKVGSEGKARDELLMTIIKNGWCRGNYSGNNDKYIVNCWELDGTTKQNLRQMAREAVTGTLVGMKTPYADVLVQAFSNNEFKSIEMPDLLRGVFAFKIVYLTKKSVFV